MDAGDAGSFDAGAFDAGSLDAGPPDAGPPDAGPPDAGPPDAGLADAGPGDAGADAGSADAGPPGVCSMVGDWSLTIAGFTAYFRFRADGTWAVAMTVAGLGTTPIGGGTWSVAGSTFTIYDNPPSGSGGGCPATDRGDYTLGFASGCGQVTFTVITDACSARQMTLDGATMTRL